MLSPDEREQNAIDEIKELAEAFTRALHNATPDGTSTPRFLAALGLFTDALLDGLRQAGAGYMADAWLATLTHDKVRASKTQEDFDAVMQRIFGTRRPPGEYDA